MERHEAEFEFKTFVSRLAHAVAARMADIFPAAAAERLRAELESDRFHKVLSEIKRDFCIHVNKAAPDEKGDIAISVLLIHLMGPMNRLPFLTDEERPRVVSAFFTTLAALLEQEKLNRHYLSLSLEIMQAA